MQLANEGMQHAVSIIDFLLDVRLDFRVCPAVQALLPGCNARNPVVGWAIKA
jgi:hypothetical protein